jgi:CBS domain-containing protein
MVGIITKTDVVRQIAHCQGVSCTMSATAVMTRDVTYCHPSDVLQDVLSIMKERGFVHIPIIDQDSRPAGVLNVAARSELDLISHHPHLRNAPRKPDMKTEAFPAPTSGENVAKPKRAEICKETGRGFRKAHAIMKHKIRSPNPRARSLRRLWTSFGIGRHKYELLFHEQINFSNLADAEAHTDRHVDQSRRDMIPEARRRGREGQYPGVNCASIGPNQAKAVAIDSPAANGQHRTMTRWHRFGKLSKRNALRQIGAAGYGLILSHSLSPLAN